MSQNSIKLTPAEEDMWDTLIFGRTKAEMGVFIPGTSARRVRKPSPEPVQPPVVEQQSTEYAEAYQREEMKQALAVSCLIIFFFLQNHASWKD